MGSTARIPYAFPAPLVAWAQFELLADGSLETPGCPAAASRPPVVGSSRLAPVVPAGHSAPMPFCGCGMHALYRPPARLFDGDRDRVGDRMRTFGLVEVWGRVMLESGEVRAEHGRVLAIAVAADDSFERHARAQAAADRLGARILTVDPDAFDPSAFERIALPGAMWLRRPDFARAVRARGIRHWRSGTNQGPELKLMSMTLYGTALAVLALGFGLAALGLAGWASASIAVVAWIAACAYALVRTNERTVCVEALVPPPEGEPPGEPLELERGRRTIDLSPVLSALPFLK